MRSSFFCVVVVVAFCASGCFEFDNRVFVSASDNSGKDGIVADLFADGSSVEFDRFVVVVGAISVGDAEFAGPAIVDVTIEDPAQLTILQPTATLSASARTGVEVTATVEPPDGAPTFTNVDDDTVALVTDSGFSVFVEGSALVGGDALTRFSWGFSTNSRYVDCHDPFDIDDDSTGIGLATEGGTALELTFHTEQLFRPDLADDEAGLRVDAIAAADDNDDGAVDVDELRGVDVADLDGYGGAGSDVVTLYDFLNAQSRALLHINGDGECEIEKR